MLLAQGCAAAKAAGPDPALCNGLPRVQARTPAGTCLQVIQSGLNFPRGISVLDDQTVLVAEMGGWESHRGRLSRLKLTGGQWVRETVFERLDRPNQLRLGSDGRVYVGVIGGVFRFDPKSPKPVKEAVIGADSSVPGPAGTGLHPLVSFVFDQQGNLLVNSGSETNNCERGDGEHGKNERGDTERGKDAGARPSMPCPETRGNPPRGSLLFYKMTSGKASGPSVYATGLRNSMALVVHASGTILQAENSRDTIHLANPKLDDASLPHDELNVIERGKHYGWPYCFDMNRTAPEYAASAAKTCQAATAPHVLLTPHAAPLSLAYAPEKSVLGNAQSLLLAAYHGYRQGGQRVVSWKVDAKGIPMPKDASRPNPVIDQWMGETRKGHSRGAPVDLAFSKDGSLWISEDRNSRLVRLVQQR